MGKSEFENFARNWYPSGRVVTWYESSQWGGSWSAEIVGDHGQLPPRGQGRDEQEAISRLEAQFHKWIGSPA